MEKNELPRLRLLNTALATGLVSKVDSIDSFEEATAWDRDAEAQVAAFEKQLAYLSEFGRELKKYEVHVEVTHSLAPFFERLLTSHPHKREIAFLRNQAAEQAKACLNFRSSSLRSSIGLRTPERSSKRC